MGTHRWEDIKRTNLPEDVILRVEGEVREVVANLLPRGCDLCLPMRAGWFRALDTKNVRHTWVRCVCNPEPEGYMPPVCTCSLCEQRQQKASTQEWLHQ